MEVLAVLALVLVERLRPDLAVRRRWARTVPALPGPAWRAPVPVALSGLTVRRTGLRLSTLLVAYVLWRVYVRTAPGNAYDTVNVLIGQPFLFLGLVLMGVVAATGGADRQEELLAALPAGPRSRVAGWACALAVAALLAYAVVAVGVARRAGTYPDLLPDAWQLTQTPALVLGGGLLGLLAARILPAWVAAPVTVVAAITWTVVLSRDGSPLTMLAPLVEWVQYREDDQVLLEPGSLGWHNAYLFGLCALGLVAALLVEAGRRRALLAAGALTLAATVTAGALALS